MTIRQIGFDVLVIVLALVISACGSVESKDAAVINLIPKPLQLEQTSGVFIIDKNTKILVEKGNEEIEEIAKYFADILKPATGFKLKIKQTSNVEPAKGTILLTTKIADKTLGAEGYELIVKADSILVRAPHAAGLFYGVQTIRQLLPKEIESKERVKADWKIPCVRISDKPAFVWRGFMLDSCRHFQDKDFVKRYIDLLAYHKLNRFHWHLTEDNSWRIEIKKYPRLTEIGAWPGPAEMGVGGFYTQDEIREVVAYAKSRYITVVPEFDMPGHSTVALVAYPEYSCSGGPFDVSGEPGRTKFTNKNGRHTFCAGNDETYTFLKDVLAEVIDLFDTPYIHIGGDERPAGHWDKCPKCQKKIKDLGLKNESHLQNWFMEQINDFIVSKNRRSMGWAENMKDGIPKNQIVQGWHGGETDFAVLQKGFQSVNSDHVFCYLDYPTYAAQLPSHSEWMGVLGLERMYSFNPIPAGATVEQAKLMLGVEAPLWTENVLQDRVDLKVWPRLLATIDIGWSPAKGRDFNEFVPRVKKHLERLEIMGVKYDTALPCLQTEITKD